MGGQFFIASNAPCAGCCRGTAPDRRAIVRRRTGATAGRHGGEDRAGLPLLFAWLSGPPGVEAFYSGPWRDGIVRRYGMEPEIEFFTVFAKTDNQAGTVTVVEAAQSA